MQDYRLEYHSNVKLFSRFLDVYSYFLYLPHGSLIAAHGLALVSKVNFEKHCSSTQEGLQAC